jgi:hypothetical protein
MKKLLVYAMVFGLCYGLAFYFSFKKIGNSIFECMVTEQNGELTLGQVRNQRDIEKLNECVTDDFNFIDRHMFPNGVIDWEFSF